MTDSIYTAQDTASVTSCWTLIVSQYLQSVQVNYIVFEPWQSCSQTERCLKGRPPLPPYETDELIECAKMLHF